MRCAHSPRLADPPQRGCLLVPHDYYGVIRASASSLSEGLADAGGAVARFSMEAAVAEKALTGIVSPVVGSLGEVRWGSRRTRSSSSQGRPRGTQQVSEVVLAASLASNHQTGGGALASAGRADLEGLRF